MVKLKLQLHSQSIIPEQLTPPPAPPITEPCHPSIDPLATIPQQLANPLSPRHDRPKLTDRSIFPARLVIAARSPPMGISSCCLSCMMTMRFRQSRSFRILTLTCGLAIASGSFLLFKGIQASDARSRSHLSEVGFFQGNWECKLKNLLD
jgi:hypothetical protein